MAQWLLLLLLIALGLGGYWLMGRVDGFLSRNLRRGAAPEQPVEGWTAETLCCILGRKACSGEGCVHGSGPQSSGATHGFAG